MTWKDDWAPYDAKAHGWTLEHVAHLHRRAGFRADLNTLLSDVADGFEASVERCVTGKGRASTPKNYQTIVERASWAAILSNDPRRLQATWLYRMVFDPDPLKENLCLFWHDFFATSQQKVKDLALMQEQNDLLRQEVRGSFGSLLESVVKQPAMLIWLDADSNKKGHANENLARELMELFSLGIGAYDESDVKEAARALTGWTHRDGAFFFDIRDHDTGEKRLLGQKGSFAGDDLVRLLLHHPATARHVTRKLCHHFLGELQVEETALGSLADGFAQNDFQLEFLVRTILRSTLFHSPQARMKRVSDPAGFVVGTIRSLEWLSPPPKTVALADWTSRMGQELFFPPNVGGWSGGRSWLSARAMLVRSRFAHALLSRPDLESHFGDILHRYGMSRSCSDLLRFLNKVTFGDPSKRIEGVSDRFLHESSFDHEIIHSLVHAFIASGPAQIV